MKQEPLISIIINCYNGEKYLRDAIQSVLSQTFQNWEIVFWDNQSTDHSANIFNSFSDSRLKYFYAPKHTWLYEARNYAIEQADGEFLAFLDVDDWWISTKIERQIKLFSDPEVGLVCSNFWVFNDRKRKYWQWVKRPIPVGWVLDDLLKSYFVGLLTLMIRRGALHPLDYWFDPQYHIIGDFDLVVRLSLHWKLDCVQEPMAFYRLHDHNVSTKQRGRHCHEMENWLRKMNKSEIIRSCKSWYGVENQLGYLKAIDQLLLGNKKKAFGFFHGMGWNKLKIRLLLGLLLPTFIAQKLIRR